MLNNNNDKRRSTVCDNHDQEPKKTRLYQQKAFLGFVLTICAAAVAAFLYCHYYQPRSKRDEMVRKSVQERAKQLEQEFLKSAKTVFQGDTSLYERKWLTRSSPEKNKLRVLQFNVLAHGYSHSSCGFATQYKDDAPNKIAEKEDPVEEAKWLHPEAYRSVLLGKCLDNAEQNPLELPIPPRMKRVLSVVLKENPDIITMQELDHFHDFMMPELKKLGYEGDFQNKKYEEITGKKVYGPPKYNGGLPDGCAIFWNTQKLEQIGTTVKMVLPHIKPNKLSCQVGLRVILRNKSNNKVFAVLTSHMKAGTKPKDMALKEHHAKIMGAKLETLGIPVIYSCDFNANPSRKAYKVLRESAPHIASAYENFQGEEPPLTSAKWRKGGDQPSKFGKQIVETIDFIFYSKGVWRLPVF